MASGSKRNYLEDLIRLFDELDADQTERAKSLLTGISTPEGDKIPRGIIKKATNSDQLAALIIDNFLTPRQCFDVMETILEKIPRKDLLSRPCFERYLSSEPDAKRKKQEDSRSNSPREVEVKDEVLSNWKKGLSRARDHTLSVAHLKTLVTHSDSVGYIEANNVSGSCFRVGDKHIITNSHVLSMMLGENASGDSEELKALAPKLKVCFNFQDIVQGNQIIDGVEEITYFSRNPDYAILKLKVNGEEHSAPALDRWIGPPPSADGAFISLIGHPDRRPKRIDTRCLISQNPVEDQNVKAAQLSYFGDSTTLLSELFAPDGKVYQSSFLHGSSGSPGFDDNLRLVVMHTFGYFIPKGSKDSVIEKGLSMVAIRMHLTEKNPNLAKLIFR
ncbi:serine protease FAM111B-like [Ptychodera flava]|uniref:serine protease FAM111B-like n=1 Tax=Ptychodera flava TaxID=63121 RepID=UPI00396A2B48